jgi:hypothetical protein
MEDRPCTYVHEPPVTPDEVLTPQERLHSAIPALSAEFCELLLRLIALKLRKDE